MALGGLEDYDPKRVRALRIKARLSIDQVAVACGVAMATAQRWETGKYTPTPAKAGPLARVLGVDVADLTSADKTQPTLIQLRQWRALTAETVAEQTGLSKDIIWTAERYVSKPTPETITTLAKAYEVSPGEIGHAWERGRAKKYGAFLGPSE